MAARRSAKRKAATKKVAKKKVAKKPMKRPGKKVARRIAKKRPRRQAAMKSMMGQKWLAAFMSLAETIPGLVRRIPTAHVIVITEAGVETQLKAKRGDVVAFENRTSKEVGVSFIDYWPFDLPQREILVPASDRSGWYYIPANAAAITYAVTVRYLDDSGIPGPPGDPILDVAG